MSRTDSPMEQDATLVEPFTREDVMKRTVPWRNYADAGLISAKDLELITNFDKKEPDVQQDMIADVCVSTLTCLFFPLFLLALFVTFGVTHTHTHRSCLLKAPASVPRTHRTRCRSASRPCKGRSTHQKSSLSVCEASTRGSRQRSFPLPPSSAATPRTLP